MQPLAHVSSKINAMHGCTTLIAPLAHHSQNKNAVICVNLAMDVSPLLELTADEIRQRMYTKRSELAEDELPIGLKQLHINKCPFIAPAKSLTDDNAQRLDIDKEFARAQYKRLRQHPEIREKLVAVFDVKHEQSSQDPDQQLYSGGFLVMQTKVRWRSFVTLHPRTLPHSH